MSVLRIHFLLAILISVGAAGILSGCSKSPTPSGAASSSSPTPTATVTASATSPIKTPTVSPTAAASPATPAPTKTTGATLTTIPAAEAFVQSYAESGVPFTFVGSDVTWNPNGTLHTLRATPSTSASYGGDYYFFFVNGSPAGRQMFDRAVTNQVLDATTFQVTYQVYKPGDAHCCPSGGQATVRFRWDGKTVAALDPMTGATQS